MNRYNRLKGPTVPFGYKQSDNDKNTLEPIQEQLDALDQAEDYLKRSSYAEVARWLSEYTGRTITAMGLWKRIKVRKADKKRYAQQKRYASPNEVEVAV